MHRSSLVSTFAIVGLLFTAARSSAQAPAAAPAKVPAPTKAPALENAYVRVANSLEDVGHKSPPHGHEFAKISIFLTPGVQTLVTVADNSQDVRKVKPGDVIYDGPAIQHISINASNTPLYIIQVEFRKKADGTVLTPDKADPLVAAPTFFSVIADNPQVRVLRLRIPPGARTPQYRHGLKTATVLLTAQQARVTAGGTSTDVTRPEHDAFWTDAPVAQQIENTGRDPFEAVVVELKMK